MTRQPTPLEKRVVAAQLLLDEWRDRPFSWKKGVTCVRLTAAHLRRMGYVPPLAKAGRFASALGARRALERAGFASLSDALDSMGLERIAPASAIVGDIIELPGEAPFNALTVAMGNGRVLGFHQDMEGAAVLQPSDYIGAWRVEPS
ncbi:hypothetical protein [Rhizorhabdus sp.]|uniref:DUF6950 family protein n=1 Tax=Rhizorhabdus sp. TaxID=1968843 RepID=UPI0035AE75BF